MCRGTSTSVYGLILSVFVHRRRGQLQSQLQGKFVPVPAQAAVKHMCKRYHPQRPGALQYELILQQRRCDVALPVSLERDRSTTSYWNVLDGLRSSDCSTRTSRNCSACWWQRGLCSSTINRRYLSACRRQWRGGMYCTADGSTLMLGRLVGVCENCCTATHIAGVG